MADELIPDDVKRFILTSIDSIPHLEALLLLRGNPGIEWDAGGIARRLYITEKVAEELLTRLREAGFIAASADNAALFHFSPASTALDRMVSSLADTYSSNLIGVTNLIHGKSGQQVRKFADAFRLRKE